MPPASSLRLRARRYAAGFGGFQPDARRFLVAALLAGAAISLFYIDFNLYLVALGFDTPAIGLIATIVVLYVSAIVLYWRWFAPVDRRLRAGTHPPGGIEPTASDGGGAPATGGPTG
jgi:hypothetical protein